MKKKKLARLSQYLMAATLLGLLALILVCASIIHREKRKLDDLIAEGGSVSSVRVYAQPLELSAAAPVTRQHVVAMLRALDYRLVSNRPVHAGEYSEGDSELVIFSRGFNFPDRVQPETSVTVHFGHALLQRIESADRRSLEAWRLEPLRLAEWTVGASSARIRIHLGDLPTYVPQAVVAIEDKRFYAHGALDSVGLARAFFIDLRHGGWRQGGSTLSQQLARSIFLSTDRTWRRKVVEAGLAIYLEAHFTKPQLLEMYLNQVYWGQDGSSSLLGIEAVSRSLFGKSAAQLTLSDSALLAGMLQSPNRLSPRNTLSSALVRRDHVLHLMQEQGFISRAQHDLAVKEKVILSPLAGGSNSASYFLAMVHDDLADRYGLSVLVTSGWSIFTTLDPLLQKDAVAAIGRSRMGAQAALVALDPGSGAIRAWVGGTDYATNPFDHAGRARRQPGSAFKPFVALAALESRRATTATLLNDTPLTTLNHGLRWTPQNYDRRYHGSVAIWDALVQSLNVPFARLGMQTGLPQVVEVAHRAGIDSPLQAVPSLALGTSEVSVLELTSAYGTLAAQGRRTAPYFIERIVGPDGTIVESHQGESVAVFAPQPVFLVTQMLEAVLVEGTGRASHAMGFNGPGAGKTGTSEKNQDAWFVGYHSGLVCGVWVGFDRPKSLGSAAAGVALPIWVKFMNKALAREPAAAFVAPPGLNWKKIDPASGALARSGCPVRIERAFLGGTEPTQDCPLHPGGIIGFFRRLTGKAPKPSVVFGH